MDNNSKVAFLIFFIFFFSLVLMIRKISKRRDYDEREIAIRGKAYKSAYLTFLVLVIANGFVYVFTGKGIFDPYVTAILSMCISIIVFVFKCMLNGAYLPSNVSTRKYTILVTAVGVMDIITALVNKDIVILGGKNYFINVNTTFVLGVMLILVAAGIAWFSKKETDGDEK